MSDILDGTVASITAEVMPMLSLERGTVFGFTIYADRHATSRGLTKGRKVGTIINETMPGLLRSVADLCEQEGGTFVGLVKKFEARS